VGNYSPYYTAQIPPTACNLGNKRGARNTQATHSRQSSCRWNVSEVPQCQQTTAKFLALAFIFYLGPECADTPRTPHTVTIHVQPLLMNMDVQQLRSFVLHSAKLTTIGNCHFKYFYSNKHQDVFCLDIFRHIHDVKKNCKVMVKIINTILHLFYF